MADNPAQDRKLGLPRIEVNGRWFTKYQPDVALDIVERIAEGETLSAITDKKADNPTIAKSTFLRWVATVPELRDAYMAAKQISALSLADEATDRAREIARFPGNAQKVSAYNTLINQLRWAAGKADPTNYGERSDTKIVVPVTINTTLDLGDGQRQTVEVPDIYSIPAKPVEDAEFTEVEKSGPKEQPMLQSERKPKKQVLTPRNPNWSAADRKK